MSEYKLYCFAQSGNAYKAALMLNLNNAQWTPVFVDFFNGETRTEEYRALNPMGEVPVLVHQNTTLTQSGVILDYLSTQLGKMGGENETERREILRWILFDNHKFTSYIATFRFLRTFTDKADPNVLNFLEGRVKASLKVLEQQLEGRPYVTGDRMTIADLSLCGYLYFSEQELGFATQAYPAISSWLQRIQSTPGWKHPHELMPGHPLPE